MGPVLHSAWHPIKGKFACYKLHPDLFKGTGKHPTVFFSVENGLSIPWGGREAGEDEEESSICWSPPCAPQALCSDFQPIVAPKPHDNKDGRSYFTDEETGAQAVKKISGSVSYS